MPALTDEAREELSRHRGIDASQHGWRQEIGKHIADELLKHPIKSEEDIGGQAMTVDEISVAVFGMSDDSTRQAVSQATGPLGFVQTQALTNGYVVCSARVERPVDAGEGAKVMRRFSARFLSDDPAVVRSAIVHVLEKRADSSLDRAAKVLDLIETRIPALIGVKDALGRRYTSKAIEALTK